jgi:hypothetical protein
MNARVVALVLAATVVTTMSGVAGATTGPPLTKQQYVAVYNALCDASIAKAQAAIQSLKKDHTSSDFVKAIAPIYQARLNKTRKLVPPANDRKRVKKLLDAQQAAVKTAKNDDNTPIIGGNGGKGPKPKSDKLAQAYGLESGTCVNPANSGPRAGSGPVPPGGNGNPTGTQPGPTDTRPCPGVGPCAGDNDSVPPPST